MKRDIVLIVIDTLRADHLSFNGYFRNTAPSLKDSVKMEVNFANFFASAVATDSAFPSIFTGLAVIHHGFYSTPWNISNSIQMDDNIPTVAVASLVNFRDYPKHLIKGFEYYFNPTRDPQMYLKLSSV